MKILIKGYELFGVCWHDWWAGKESDSLCKVRSVIKNRFGKVTGKPMSNYKCPHCGKNYKTKYGVNNHERLYCEKPESTNKRILYFNGGIKGIAYSSSRKAAKQLEGFGRAVELLQSRKFIK